MTRRRRRKIIILVMLLILLALLSVLVINYRATRTFSLGFVGTDPDEVTVPQYLYSFAGAEDQRLSGPVGVLVDGDDVFVADSKQGLVYRFNQEGEQQQVFGLGDLVVPLYIAKNPVDGNLYVTDRRFRSIEIFTTDGEYVGRFDPDLPADQLPSFATEDSFWAPIAITFGPDGSMYVTELFKGHRILKFSPDGEFLWSFGNVGIVTQVMEAPSIFQFPNSIKVMGDELWVVDSNNRRAQVFTTDGDFLRILPLGGLPRGMAFLPGVSDESTVSNMFVAVDTLAHDVTIWDVGGRKILNFGSQGVLEGQFGFPTDISITPERRMFISDTSNGRVQVWGWPEQLAPIPMPDQALEWLACLSPLLLLPLLMLRRKRRFHATREFVEDMAARELLHTMPHRRRRWIVLPEDHEALRDIVQEDIRAEELLEAIEFSESDVSSLMEKLEIEHEPAVILALAQRAHVFCTNDPELRRVAKTLGIDVVDREEYLERFAKAHDDERLPPE